MDRNKYKRDKILAAIITYNPEIKILQRNIVALEPQVEKILIFDNASDNIDQIRQLLLNNKNVNLITNEKNLGLPINYNRGMRYCADNGYEWLLTMDQDTVVPDNMISYYSELFNKKEIAIISPVLVDINIQSFEEVKKRTPSEEWTSIQYCISSAAINRVSILLELNGFDEKLFIDQVDFDYCRNVLEHGYIIARHNRCFIEHRIGNGKKIKILGRDEVAYNHPPFRKYYFFRNRIYFARKYHISIIKEPVYYRNFLKHFIILFYENNKREKIKQAVKGIRDGFKL